MFNPRCLQLLGCLIDEIWYCFGRQGTLQFFFGTVGDGDGETGKGGSVWSGHHSRYHVLRFLSFII